MPVQTTSVRFTRIALYALYAFSALTLLVWNFSYALEIDQAKLQQLASRKYGAQAVKSVDAWLSLIRSGATLSEPEKLAQANAFWNDNVRSGEDAQIWNQPDYWATPLESLGRRLGDCEDYVIGKYFSLVAMGVAPEKLRLIYVRARIGGAYSSEQVAHMVLGYYATPNAVPLVLDNLISVIMPASQRRDLTPVFSFNADGVYVDGKNAAPVDRISRWQDLLLRMEREGMTP